MPGLLPHYTESELDPAVHAEILVESARNEARVAILEIIMALIFGAWLGFGSRAFTAVAIFALVSVAFLLVDATMRRSAAKRLRGQGPQPAPEG